MPIRQLLDSNAFNPEEVTILRARGTSLNGND